MKTLDRTKLLAARFRAAHERPYFATALFSLTVIATESVPTMGVDKHWRCYVSPSFVDDMPVEQLAAVWIHEVAHLLRDHHGRSELLPAPDRDDHLRLNVAQDCEINDDLLADGLPLPKNRIEPATFGLPGGQLFEAYLQRLPQLRHTLNCGSGAHGTVQPWEAGPAHGPAVSRVEAEAIRRQTAEAIRAHQRARGNVPGGWTRWAHRVLEPRIDWRTALASAVREAAAWAGGAVDYTYHRPSRRGAAMRSVVLPSLRRPLPRVAVVIDTSGSMGEEELATALSEVTGVLRAVGVRGNRINVLACDADVHTARRVASVAEIELAGGGGTDMRVGIEAALRGPQPPHFIIVLTDGYTPWPEEPLQRTRIIAGLVGPEAPLPPEWIHAIHIG